MNQKSPSIPESVTTALKSAQSFVLMAHPNPDGDACGAQIALSGFLRSQGKDVRIMNFGSMGPEVTWLDFGDQHQLVPWGEAVPKMEADLVVFLDFHSRARLEHFAEALSADQKILIVDHHVAQDPASDLMLLDTSASATGLLAQELIEAMGGELNPAMAEAVYVSIHTDTGGFRFSNTDARTLHAVARLLEAGADPVKIYRQVYEQSSAARLRLLGQCLSQMELLNEGKLCVFAISQDDFKKWGAEASDCEGFLDVARTLKDVSVCVLIREIDDQSCKVSWRSSHDADVQQVASHFSGGGHKKAAGATVKLAFEEAVSAVVKQTQTLL